MIIPFLLTHQYRHGKKTESGSSIVCCIPFNEFFKFLFNPYYTQSDPDGICITRSRICVITFAGLIPGLIKVNNDGKPGKKEQEHCHQEILSAPVILEY